MISGLFGLVSFLVLASDSSIQLRYPPKMQWSLGSAIWGTMWARGEIISDTVGPWNETVLITIWINLARIKVYSRGQKSSGFAKMRVFLNRVFNSSIFISSLWHLDTRPWGP
jgi:hypothetical protein